MEKNNIKDQMAKLDQEIQAVENKLLELKNGSLAISTGKSFESLELQLQTCTRKYCDLIAAKQLQLSLFQDEVRESANQLIKAIPQKMKNYGTRLTPVVMANGTKVEMLTSYFARPCEKKTNEAQDFIQP